MGTSQCHPPVTNHATEMDFLSSGACGTSDSVGPFLTRQFTPRTILLIPRVPVMSQAGEVVTGRDL